MIAKFLAGAAMAAAVAFTGAALRRAIFFTAFFELLAMSGYDSCGTISDTSASRRIWRSSAFIKNSRA